MRRVHHFSGLTITIFVGLHLLNHFISIFGPEAHIQFMNSLRVVYRNLFVESILLFVIVLQIISGVKLFFLMRNAAKGFFDKLHLWSGLYMAIFFVFHVTAVFVGRLVLELDTNIYFGVAGLNTFPYYLFFVPYYGLGMMAFFGHIASIHSKKMSRNVFNLSAHNQALIILGIGFLYVIVTFYGLTNGFSGIELPHEYNVMIGK